MVLHAFTFYLLDCSTEMRIFWFICFFVSWFLFQTPVSVWEMSCWVRLLIHLGEFSNSSSASWRPYLGQAWVFDQKRYYTNQHCPYNQIWFLVSHGRENNTKAIILLLAVRISHFGNLEAQGQCLFVPGLMRLCTFKIRCMDTTSWQQIKDGRIDALTISESSLRKWTAILEFEIVLF